MELQPADFERLVNEADKAYHERKHYDVALGSSTTLYLAFIAQFIYDSLHPTAQAIDVALAEGYGHGV